jgi:hypothetical protein
MRNDKIFLLSSLHNSHHCCCDLHMWQSTDIVDDAESWARNGDE